MSELAAVLAKQRRRSEAGLVHESTPEKSSADAQHGSIQKSTPDQMIVKPVEDHDGTYFDQAGSELKTILERRRRRSEVGATAAYVTPSSPEAKAESPPLAAKPEPTPAAAKEQKGQQNEENHHMGADPHKECETGHSARYRYHHNMGEPNFSMMVGTSHAGTSSAKTAAAQTPPASSAPPANIVHMDIVPHSVLLTHSHPSHRVPFHERHGEPGDDTTTTTTKAARSEKKKKKKDDGQQKKKKETEIERLAPTPQDQEPEQEQTAKPEAEEKTPETARPEAEEPAAPEPEPKPEPPAEPVPDPNEGKLEIKPGLFVTEEELEQFELYLPSYHTIDNERLLKILPNLMKNAAADSQTGNDSTQNRRPSGRERKSSQSRRWSRRSRTSSGAFNA